jgi:signal transduction histidine kinase
MAEPMLGWLRRPGIGRRIALAMALALFAVQVQAFIQIWLFARAEVHLVGTRWLAETARDVANTAFAVPESERAAALRRRFAGSPVAVAWSRAAPWDGPEEQVAPEGRRLAATVRAMVDPAMRVAFRAQSLEYLFPFRSVRVGVQPPEVAAGLAATPLPPDAPEEVLPASLRIAVQGPDGSWVSITPVGFGDLGLLAAFPVSPLAVAGLIIGLASIATARRLLAPLDRLVEAAGRIGTARAFVPVPADGLAEFGAVARAFEEIQHRLLRFDADRTQMLASMSHDLGSALTRLRLAVEPGGGREPDPVLLREIEDMQAMVESTLAFASGEARPGARRPTDIAALLITLVDHAGDLGHACSYRGPDHAEAPGHPPALRRAFWNLIDNAVKYGGTARVCLSDSPGGVRVAIADDGPGIPAERMEEALAPFRRLDPARGGAQRGVGLGLTIARDVVVGHGGTLELRTGETGGLVVEVTLPRD